MKDKTRGFISGLLTCALIATLCTAAIAANRTITIDDNIRITLNGASFTPRDVNGKEISAFTYNGTTYVPMRSISEALGVQVDYNSSTRTASLTTKPDAVSGATKTAPAQTPSATYIGADKAKSIALAKAPKATVTKCELDIDHGTAKYDIELREGRTEYDCEINAVTGAVLQWDVDYND